MPKCPRCKSELDGPNGEHKYFCSDDDCTVQFVKFHTPRNKDEWNPKKIAETGISIIQPWWGR